MDSDHRRTKRYADCFLSKSRLRGARPGLYNIFAGFEIKFLILLKANCPSTVYDPEFFQPLRASHFSENYPENAKFLGLPRGFRFLFTPDNVDVWFDESLLAV
jgi:hypothetical protein